MPRNATLNIVYATVTPQLMVKFKTGAVVRVDNGPNYFIDKGHLANPPPAGSNTPHKMGLTPNRHLNMAFREKKLQWRSGFPSTVIFMPCAIPKICFNGLAPKKDIF
jgi:hypothetical protein